MIVSPSALHLPTLLEGLGHLTWGLMFTFSTAFSFNHLTSSSTSKCPMLHTMASSFICSKCLWGAQTHGKPSGTKSSPKPTLGPPTCHLPAEDDVNTARGSDKDVALLTGLVHSGHLIACRDSSHESSRVASPLLWPQWLTANPCPLIPSMAACSALMGSISVMMTRAPKPLRAWAQPLPTSP